MADVSIDNQVTILMYGAEELKAFMTNELRERLKGAAPSCFENFSTHLPRAMTPWL